LTRLRRISLYVQTDVEDNTEQEVTRMTYRRILVPFDDSPLARAALSIGAWLAWRSNGELDLVRAVPHVHAPFTPRPVPGMAHLEAEQDANNLAESKTELSVEASRLREKGITATGVALAGEPLRVLIDYIKGLDIDLVVMGTHGRPLTQRWLLGSVANVTARTSPVPVLLVPQEGQFHRDDELRVLVAFDGSKVATAALDAALSLVRTVPTTVTLFEVLPGDSPSTDEKTVDWYEKPVLGAPPDLDEAHERLLKAGVASERAYSFGDAAAEIVEFAERGKFDLVVIGTHGRTGLDRLVTGSVAEQVVQRATIPILITSGAAAPASRGQMMGAGARDS